jgi:hypothetical protein
MKFLTVLFCVACGVNAFPEAKGVKDIVVDESKFSDIYPAVWFSPSTGEIAPLKEKSEVPPEKKYEIWIEPDDPEFAFLHDPRKKPKDIGFVLLGEGPKLFEHPKIPEQPKFELDIRRRIRNVHDTDGLVFYCKGRTGECLLLITVVDKKKRVIKFRWRPLGKNSSSSS